MKKRTNRVLKIFSLLVFGLFFLAGLAPSGTYATIDLFKAAKKQFGKEVKSCKYCHSVPMPKKDHAALNDVGKWLVAQQKKRKAKSIDVSWLRDYKKEAK